MWMNEHEVEELQHNLDPEDTPHLADGAHVLATLVEWTNENSDGWPYWTKPSRAAASLMDLFHERNYAIRFGHGRDGSPLTDITRADLLRVTRPIKAFLTKQGVDWNADLTWATTLPAA